MAYGSWPKPNFTTALFLMNWLKRFAGMAIIAGGVCVVKAAYIPAKGVAAKLLMERAWSQSQRQGRAILPWHSLDARPLARLSIPRLNKSEILLDVDSGQALGFAPSHMSETPRPGELGLSVIAAHKNTHFAFLEHLKLGDVIEIENIDGRKTEFKITHFDIVDKDNSGIDLNAPKQIAKIALVTCYPFSALSYGGPSRYVVYGKAV